MAGLVGEAGEGGRQQGGGGAKAVAVGAGGEVLGMTYSYEIILPDGMGSEPVGCGFLLRSLCRRVGCDFPMRRLFVSRY
eukprot:COSAG01_NODE_7774_length_3063_cov_2.191970_6_plen_79_part_00